jgi:hypothetical protein
LSYSVLLLEGARAGPAQAIFFLSYEVYIDFIRIFFFFSVTLQGGCSVSACSGVCMGGEQHTFQAIALIRTNALLD